MIRFAATLLLLGLLACAGRTGNDAAAVEGTASPRALRATDEASETAGEPMVLRVNLADPRGPAGPPLGTGMHGGVDDDVPAHLVDPLHLAGASSHFGTLGSSVQDSIVARLARSGGVLVVYLSHYGMPEVQRNPDDPDAWALYRDDHLLPLLDRATAAAAPYGVPVHVEVWPEANIGTPLWARVDGDGSDRRDEENFLRFWTRTVRLVRERYPGVEIVGPGFHWPAAERCRSGGDCRSNVNVSLEEFLRHAERTETLPDLVGWHSFPSVWGDPGVEPCCDNDLLGEIREVRGIVEATLGDADAFRYAVSEAMGNATTFLDPACNLFLVQGAERARDLGLAYRGMGYVHGPCEGRLAGLVVPVGDGWRLTPAYRLLVAYASLSGERLLPDTPPGVALLGAIDGEEVRLLIGRSEPGTGGLTLVLETPGAAGWDEGAPLAVRIDRYPAYEYGRPVPRSADPWRGAVTVSDGTVRLDPDLLGAVPRGDVLDLRLRPAGD